ncbi:MAG: DUF5666 domain-containing protein [Caldisericia bacterium]|nr:DUF5666 domain-containing protein [Caldisericia bacterium]
MTKILGFVLVATLVVTSLLVPVKAAPGGEKGPGGQMNRIEGILQNVNTEAKTFGLEAKNPDGETVVFSFVWIDNTMFIRDQEESTVDSFKNGESVTVAGRINFEDKTGVAVVLCFGAFPDKDPGRPPLVKGLIADLDKENSTFLLKSKSPEGEDVVFQVTCIDKTRFFRDLQPAKLEDFKNGEEVSVVGVVKVEEKTIAAMGVFLGDIPRDPGRDPGNTPPKGPKQVSGMISDLNFEKKTFTLNLNENTAFPVEFFEWTNITMDNELVHWKTLRNDMKVGISGPVDPTDKTLEAHRILIYTDKTPGDPGNPGPRANLIQGTISSYDTSANSFNLTAEVQGETKTIVVKYSDQTRFFRDGEISAEDAFKNGEKVTIGGRMQEDFFEAFMVAYGELPERGKNR